MNGSIKSSNFHFAFKFCCCFGPFWGQPLAVTTPRINKKILNAFISSSLKFNDDDRKDC